MYASVIFMFHNIFNGLTFTPKPSLFQGRVLLSVVSTFTTPANRNRILLCAFLLSLDKLCKTLSSKIAGVILHRGNKGNMPIFPLVMPWCPLKSMGDF